MSESPATTTALIDPSRMEDLKTIEPDENSTFIQELVEIFGSDVPLILQEMRQEYQSGKIPELGALAHSLKSTCLNLGVTGMAELAARIERPSGGEDFRMLLDQLEHTFPEALKELQKYVAK